MRNARWILLSGLLLAGCVSANAVESRKELNAGYRALGQNDYESAMRHAEEFLRNNPNSGPGTAEALYLEGRVYEQRALAADAAERAAEARSNLQYARSTYEQALTLKSSPQVSALLHAGVANAAYHQDDLATAMSEWAASYEGLQQPDAKAWVLYRVGLCQQRLGRFEQADNNFASVRQRFPASEAALRAAQHQGARGFYVRIGAFVDAANANKTMASLQSQGFHAVRSAESTGRQMVSVGPANTYAEAKALRARLLGAFPGALIEP